MAKQNNRPIGIFDSGVGGLTVLAEVKKALPGESVIYVGDTANAPYGGKSPEALLKHGRDIIRFLRGHNVKAVVLACGTTSSTVYEELARENPDIPLVDVIRPGVQACAKMNKPWDDTSPKGHYATDTHAHKTEQPFRLGIIATAATIKSGLFARMLKAQRPDISILTQACPLFMPMVEAGVTHSPITKWVAENYIGHWQGKVDVVVLGCTHYPLLTEAISSVLGMDMQYINLATYAAQALKDQLSATLALGDGKTPATHKYYVSGAPSTFNEAARFILNYSPDADKMQLYQ